MNPQMEMLLNKLKDERSKKVIFVSHCILNENTRYLGGAFREGAINEILNEIQKQGIGIIQMKCPEKETWGGVLKPSMWFPLFNKNRLLQKVLMSAFLFSTKRRYKKIAKEVLNDIKEYYHTGFHIIGIIGVSASPTCGVHTSIDIDTFSDFLRGSTIESISRTQINQEYLKKSLIHRNGLFIDILQDLLEKSNMKIPFYEHDLLQEIDGNIISLKL